MRLYSYWRSSASWRVRIVLALKKLDYEYVPISIHPGVDAQHAPEYGKINAIRQVPVLEWQNEAETCRLTQSVAIIEHLEESHPSPQLLPHDPLYRARVRELVEIVNSGIQPLQNIGALMMIRALGGDEAMAKQAYDVNLKGMIAIEEHLKAYGGRHAVHNTLTLADVFLVPQLYNATRFGVDLSKFPLASDVAARASELPAFIAAHPNHQIDAPQEMRE
jgi:maleylpyruvate isomerase